MSELGSFIKQAPTVPVLLRRAFWGFAEQAFATVREPGTGRLLHMSYRDVGARTEALAAALTGKLGLAAGTPIGILSRNRLEWLVADFSCALAGLAVVPLHAPWPDDDMLHVLADGAVAAVVVEAQYAQRMTRLVHSSVSSKDVQLIVIDGRYMAYDGDVAAATGSGDDAAATATTVADALAFAASCGVRVHTLSSLLPMAFEAGYAETLAGPLATVPTKTLTLPMPVEAAAAGAATGAATATAAAGSLAAPAALSVTVPLAADWGVASVFEGAPLASLPPCSLPQAPTTKVVPPLPEQPVPSASAGGAAAAASSAATATTTANTASASLGLLTHRHVDVVGSDQALDRGLAMHTLVYTSGTSGRPKGVVTTKKRWLRDAVSAGVWAGLGDEEVMLSHMALAHGADRGLCWQALAKGARVCFANTRCHETVMADMREFKPSVLLGLSHFWARLYGDFWAELERRVLPLALRAVADALTTTSGAGPVDPSSLPVHTLKASPHWLRLLQFVASKSGQWHALVDETVAATGGALFWGYTGGAVTAPVIKEWMRTVLWRGQQRVKDSYGSTEFPGLSLNGEIAADIDMRLMPLEEGGGAPAASNKGAAAERGEILVRAGEPGLWMGYHNRPDATASVSTGGDADVQPFMDALAHLAEGAAGGATPAGAASAPVATTSSSTGSGHITLDVPPAVHKDFGAAWYRTGDLGELVETEEEALRNDPRGRGTLRILDRAKNRIELYVEGRSVWIPNAEALAARICTLAGAEVVEQCFLWGDRNQEAPLAVVVPNHAWLEATYARVTGTTPTPHAAATPAEIGTWCADPRVADAVRAAIAAVLSPLVVSDDALAAQDPASIRPFAIPAGVVLEPVAWTAENGWLTVTHKPKRAALTERYRSQLDSVYAALESGRTVAATAGAAATPTALADTTAVLSNDALLGAVAAAAASAQRAYEQPTMIPQAVKGVVDFLEPSHFSFVGPDVESTALLNTLLGQLREQASVIRAKGAAWGAEMSAVQAHVDAEGAAVDAAVGAVVAAKGAAAVAAFKAFQAQASSGTGTDAALVATADAALRDLLEAAPRARLTAMRVRYVSSLVTKSGRTAEEAAIKTAHGTLCQRLIDVGERLGVRIPYHIWTNGWWKAPRVEGDKAFEVPPELRQSLGDAKAYDLVTGRLIERDIRDFGVQRHKFLDAPDVNLSFETAAWLKPLVDVAAEMCAAPSPVPLASTLRVALDHHLNPYRFGQAGTPWAIETGHPFQLRDRVDRPVTTTAGSGTTVTDTPATAITSALKLYAKRPLLGTPHPAAIDARRVFAPDTVGARPSATAPPPAFARRGTAPLRSWYLPLPLAAGLADGGDDGIMTLDGFRWLRYEHAWTIARRLGTALRSLPGVSLGDVILLAGYNTNEWALLDFACCIAGLRAVGVHTTNDTPTTLHVLNNSDARVLVATSDLFPAAAAAAPAGEEVWTVASVLGRAAELPNLKHVVVMDAFIAGESDDAVAAAGVVPSLQAAAVACGGSLTVRQFADASSVPASAAAGHLSLWSLLDMAAPAHDAALAATPLPDPVTLPPGGREDMFTLLYTSGSSGAPKGVIITAAAFYGDVGGERLWAEPLVTPCFIPLSHSSDRFKIWKWALNGGRVGFTFYDASHWRAHEKEKKDDMVRSAVTTTTTAAVEISLERHYGVGTLFEQIRSLRPTALAAPPILWTGLFSAYHEECVKLASDGVAAFVGKPCHSSAELAAAALARKDPAGLEAVVAAARSGARTRIAALLGDRLASCITGGGPTPLLIKRFASSLAAKAKFADSYGATECGSISRDGVPPRVGSSKEPVRIKLAPVAGVTGGAVIPPADGAAYVAAVDAWDDGSVGKIGEVLVCSPLVSPGYWRNPAKTADAFVEVASPFGVERWYRTGDIGERFTRCRIRLLGRTGAAKKNHTGYVVFPGALEALLETSPLVRYIVVDVVAPGNVVTAVVVPDAPTTTAAELQADFRRLLVEEGLDADNNCPAAFAILPSTTSWSTSNGLMNGECKKNRGRILDVYAANIAAAVKAL